MSRNDGEIIQNKGGGDVWAAEVKYCIRWSVPRYRWR